MSNEEVTIPNQVPTGMLAQPERGEQEVRKWMARTRGVSESRELPLYLLCHKSERETSEMSSLPLTRA